MTKLAEIWAKVSQSKLFIPILVLACVGAIGIASQVNSGQVESDPERVQRLRESFACPECDGQLISESNASVASTISRVIEQEVAAGSTDTEIRDLLLEDWGQEILANPSAEGIAFWVWMFPIVAIMAASLLFGWWLYRRSTGNVETQSVMPKFLVAAFLGFMILGAGYGLTVFAGERGVNDALTGSIDRTPGQEIASCQEVANNGDIGQGIRCLDELLEQDPDNSAILANKGWFFALTARSAEDPQQISTLNEFAINNLDRAIELRSTNRDALAWRAVASFWAQDLDTACSDLDALYKLDPPDDVVGLTSSIAANCA